jgi:muconate cycloisomerase
MKITGIETIPVRVPIKPELAIRSGRGGSHVVSPFLIVKVHTDEGLIGLGEASCTPRWSGEDQFTARHFIDACFAPLLIGEDPSDVDACFRKFSPVVANNPFTKSAVEMALWDLRGKAANKPVYELLGGKVREFVPTKFSISGVDAEAAARIALWALERGFRAMKVKVGIDPAGDVARVLAVRQAVGNAVKLGVDANGGWPDSSAALAVLGKLREANLAFVEQPCPAREIHLMGQVRRWNKVPVIADESVYTLADAMEVKRLSAADVLSIYVGKAGGIGPAREIARAFAAKSADAGAGGGSLLGSNLELGVGSAAMAHLALATKEIIAEQYPCDIIGPLFYEDDILRDPLPLTGGAARVHEGLPGLGVELDDEKVEKYRVVT